MRRIATIRNQLIHDVNIDEVQDREKFRADVREAAAELEAIGKSKGWTGGNCAVM
jgi:hypothetical protein